MFVKVGSHESCSCNLFYVEEKVCIDESKPDNL